MTLPGTGYGPLGGFMAGGTWKLTYGILDVPSIISALGISTHEIEVEWSCVDNVIGYEIRYKKRYD